MRATILLVASWLSVAAGAADNLVKNPGFEALAPGGKTLVAWGLPRLAGARLAWDDAVRHSGKRSARVEGLDPEKQSRYVQAWRQDVGPLPGGALMLNVWVRGADVGRGRIGVLHRDKTGKVLRNQAIGSLDGTFEWRELAGLIEPVPGTVRLQLVMGIQKSKGTLWLDDVSVVPAADASEALGSATMTPAEPQVAGTMVPARIVVTLGTRGLAAGGSIQLRWERWRPAREFRLKKLRAECSQAGAVFEVTVPPRKRTWPPIRKPIACTATLKGGGPLPEGARVVIATDLTYTKYSNVACPLRVLLAPSAGSAGRPLGEPFVVAAKGGPAARLLCIAEARPLAGTPSRVTVAVTDEHGNPASAFRGTVRLACNAKAGLPAACQFTEADGGSHEFAGTFPKGVVSRVRATCGEMTATSNPILPRGEAEPGIYFGDIHSHCEISADAVGDPSDAYDYARRFWGMDLAALSDHSPRGAQWTRAVEAANRHNTPGRFVTFVAFEWSDARRGHRNAYYRGDTGPEHPRLPDNMASWWAFFDKQKTPVLTVPHHPNTNSGVRLADGRLAWGPVDWSQINHRYQRVAELNQNRGSFEVPDGPKRDLRVVRRDCGASVQTALAKGHRLGFIGSTDTHSGRPGTGIARCAIVSRDFSRAGLWDALHARRCYATSGKHILVLFAVNGQPMGSEIRLAKPTTKRDVAWRVVGTGPLKRVDLLRNNTVVKSWDGAGKDDLAGAFAMDAPPVEPEWWYLRAIQADAEMAWSSPVWIDPPEGQQ